MHMLFKATAQVCVCVCVRQKHTHTHTHRLIYRPVVPADAVARLELNHRCQQCEHQGSVWVGVQFLFTWGGPVSDPPNQHQDVRI